MASAAARVDVAAEVLDRLPGPASANRTASSISAGDARFDRRQVGVVEKPPRSASGAVKSAIGSRLFHCSTSSLSRYSSGSAIEWARKR